MYDEVLQAVIDMAAQAINMPIVTGSLPPDSGIAMSGQAAPSSIMLDIGSNERMSIVCNAKNASQKIAITQLDAIHRALTRRKNFPSSDTWQVYAIQTVASPRLLGREQNPQAQWLYGSSLLVKFNVKGIEA